LKGEQPGWPQDRG